MLKFITLSVLVLIGLGCQSSNLRIENSIGSNSIGNNSIGGNSVDNDLSWWPKQPIPKGIIVCKKAKTHGESALSISLSGIVAQAQKENLVDELVWLETQSGEYDVWYAKAISRFNAEERGEFNVWQVLERYQKKGLISGYIIYSAEKSRKWHQNLDQSYNVAVSYAGVKKAIIIDETMESKVIQMGFKKILDARSISPEDCFNELKGELNKELMVTMNPHYHNNRDLAIANKSILTYGVNNLTDSIMAWVKPITPVVGWNSGSEIDFTILPSKHSLFNTASDWCNNLIVLSAGSDEAKIKKIKGLDPKTIDFSKGDHHHSFVMSDGDNMQWTIGNFIKNQNFWGSSKHGEFPIGFTSCPLNLSMMAPDVLNEMVESQPEHTTIIEYGGGYQYPDLFAIEKGTNQEAIQREFAQKVNGNMQRTGAKVFGFICTDIDSPEAIEAYKIYAEEIDDLVGMFAIQYAPYHGGNGEVFWVKNREGIEIPVVSSKFSLWQGLKGKGGGDVNKVSGAINQFTQSTEKSLSWTMVHAWSNFENPDMKNDFASGVEPIAWCIKKLEKEIIIVSPEELLWRIRWSHDQEATMSAINKNSK